MYIERVPNRNSPPAVLLRSSHWDHGKIRKVTHANLSKLPQPLVDGIALLLHGGTVVGPGSPAVRILDSRPCGHVAALLGGARQLGLPALLHVRPSRSRDLALALVLMRLLLPASRLATARKLAPDAEFAALNEALGLGPVSEQQLYDTLDWLARRQPAIEAKLARRHLQDGCLALYDLTSVWYTGEHCELARRGYSRDGKRGSRQILVGLLCDAAGRPVSAEVCAGNTADPATVPAQVDKLRRRFGLSRVVLVGDRGMLTAARIREDLAPHEELGWISALRAPAIRRLLRQRRFDPEQVGDWQLARIESPDYPGERLLVCRNPRLRRQRGQRREALLQATEAALVEIRQAAQRRSSPLCGDALKLRVHTALGQYKMRKHFQVELGEGGLSWQRDSAKVAAEAALDGLYVIRAQVPPEQLDDAGVVRAYKSLAAVERAFRHLKTVDLELRPFYVRDPDRVRAHTLVCLLAYHLEWHLRQKLAPLLYEEQDRAAAERLRDTPVAPARHTPATEAKRRTRQTAEGDTVWDFHGLLGELGTLQRNRVRFQLPGESEHPEVRLLTEPSRLQRRVFELLQLRQRDILPSSATSARLPAKAATASA